MTMPKGIYRLIKELNGKAAGPPKGEDLRSTIEAIEGNTARVAIESNDGSVVFALVPVSDLGRDAKVHSAFTFTAGREPPFIPVRRRPVTEELLRDARDKARQEFEGFGWEPHNSDK